MRVRIKTGYDEREDYYYYRSFEVVDNIPESFNVGAIERIDDVIEVFPDIEDYSDVARSYRFYIVWIQWKDEEEDVWKDERFNYAIKKEEEYEY